MKQWIAIALAGAIMSVASATQAQPQGDDHHDHGAPPAGGQHPNGGGHPSGGGGPPPGHSSGGGGAPPSHTGGASTFSSQSINAGGGNHGPSEWRGQPGGQQPTFHSQTYNSGAPQVGGHGSHGLNGQQPTFHSQAYTGGTSHPSGWTGGHVGQPGAGHELRSRDQGRTLFRPGLFARDFHAEHRFHVQPYGYPHGWYYRSWYYGQYLPFGWFTPDYYLDWGDYDLPAPPVGCEWVREGDDALLVDVWTGEVLSVYRGIFW